MSTKSYIVHLCGPGMSGRVVKYKILPMSAVKRIEENVGKEVTATTTLVEFNQKLNDMGRAEMMVATTEPMTKAEWAKSAPASVKWILLDAGTLALQWDQLFTTKDTYALRSIYDQEHTVTKGELDAIMSGKVEALED